MNTLFLAWQDPEERRWFPIGRLTFDRNIYRFVYTKGVLDARASGRFKPLASFPDLTLLYESEDLFPLFSNRVLRASRPDYPDFLAWLHLAESSPDPIALLARSGGQRGTDTLQLFPPPEQESPEHFTAHFFVHGLSHMPEASRKRAEELCVGERLLVMHDFQNPKDSRALLLRTSEPQPHDLHSVAYCPRYLVADAFEIMDRDENWPLVTVIRVNPPPAPLQFRVLCRILMRCPPGFVPCSGHDYQPLAESLVGATT